MDADLPYSPTHPDPLDAAAAFARAVALDALGRRDEAKRAYLDILAQDSSHRPSLANLAALLFETGYRGASVTVYRRWLSVSPDDPDAHASLANVLYKDENLPAAQAHFERALALDPHHVAAHRGLGALLMDLRQVDQAWEHRRLGFGKDPYIRVPYRGAGEALPLLLLASAAGGNIPLEHLLDRARFDTTILMAEFHRPELPLPAHRLLINAIGDADLCGTALASAQTVLARTSAPLINQPSAVAATGRADNARRLGALAGVRAPRIADLTRAALQAPQASDTLAALGLGFPLLLRAQGFHAGQHFVKVEGPAELAQALAELPGEALAAIEYVPSYAADGKTRKYRVLFVGGKAHPLHAAVSRHWKIHYFSADMAEHPEHRREDQAFLEDPAGVLGAPAMAALDRIDAALGLDYAGVDFGMTAAGEILLYEANATMVIPPVGPDPRWNYRRAPVQRIVDAVIALIDRKLAEGV